MMSAAMSMVASVKQTSVRPVSADLFADQSKPEEVSFAKSFNDRVGESALLPGKRSAEEATIALPGLKTATPTTNLDEVAEMLDGVKAKTIAGREISTHGELKSAAAYKTVELQAAAVTGLREKTAASNSGMKNVESPVEGDEVTDNISSNSSTSYPVQGAELTESIVPPVIVAGEDRPLVSGADSPPVQKATENVGKTKEVASAKKTAKAQENPTTSKSLQKAVGIDGNATSKSAGAISREDAVPVSQGVVTGVVVLRNDDVGKTAGGLNEAVLEKANVSSDVSPVTAGESIHKATGHGTKAAALDTETAVTAPGGQSPLPKPGADLEKTATVVVSAGSDGDSKIQSASVPTAVVHSAAESIGVTGAALITVVPGNTSGEWTATKLPVGDAGAHTAGLLVGSREQDRSGVVATSMDEMPRMLTATPTALEVGIQNGTHGWLKVRAEMAGDGVVNASVSAASSTGQEMLHRELPALAAYLQQEKVAVNAIVVHTPPAAVAEPRSSPGMDSSGGQAPQGGDEGSERQQSVKKAISNGLEEATTYESARGVDEDRSLSLATYASGGSWLSVRA